MLEPSISIDGVVSKGEDQTKELSKNQLSLIKNAGISYVDFGIEYGSVAYTDKCDKWIKEFGEACREVGIKVFQTHTPPYRNLRLDGKSLLWDIGEDEDKYLDIAIRSTAEWGAKYTVVHPCTTYSDWSDDCYEACVDMNVEYFKMLLEKAYKYDVTICIETMAYFGKPYAYCAKPYELLELKERINDDKIKFCVDTGHVHFAGEDVAKTIELLGDNLAVLHLQDNSGLNDDHNILPFGRIDWTKVAEALRKVNYKGTLNFEVQGGRLKTLDEQAKLAYLTFTRQMAEYLKRLINKEPTA